MKSVGEVMAIGRTFQESLQKALRGLETGVDGFINLCEEVSDANLDKIAHELRNPGSERLLYVGEAFRHGMDLARVHSLSHIDPWFLAQIQDLVEEEGRLSGTELNSIDRERLYRLKQKGFSDSRLAVLLNVSEAALRQQRHEMDIRPVYKRVDSCAGGVPRDHGIHVFDV